MLGTVKKWSVRGFGFVKPACGGYDCYVHISKVEGGLRNLEVGQTVEIDFDIDNATLQRRATRVIAVPTPASS